MQHQLMDYEEFITTVRDEANLADHDVAERAACATLHTLAERILPGEAEDLAERLPDELEGCLIATNAPERFHIDEFLSRIEDRADVDADAAEQVARAVFVALWKAVGPDEFADVRAELPKDFDELIDDAVAAAPPPQPPEAAPRDTISYEEFVRRVAARAGIDEPAARRAVDATLEVLAMRISDGQVEDLEPVLPARLRPAMERGRATTGGRARPLSLEGFLQEVAKREGVSEDEALRHARAVLTTLRDVIPEKEYDDTRAQLPETFRTLLRTA